MPGYCCLSFCWLKVTLLRGTELPQSVVACKKQSVVACKKAFPPVMRCSNRLKKVTLPERGVSYTRRLWAAAPLEAEGKKVHETGAVVAVEDCCAQNPVVSSTFQPKVLRA